MRLKEVLQWFVTTAMATIVATGASTVRSSRQAAAQAFQQALAKLGNAKPNFGFLFAGPEHSLAEALSVGTEATQAEIIACTSAGEISEKGLTRGGMVAMLCASGAAAEMRFASGLKSDPERVGRELAANLSSFKKKSALNDNRHLTTVLLTDGLAGTGERLVNELYERRIQSGTQIVGGAAGDDGRFKATWVGSRTGASPDAAAALHVFSESPWGIGVDHGLRPTTKPADVRRDCAEP